MEKINQYISVVEKAFSTATPNFSNQESVKKATANKDDLEAQLRKDSYIKVPFVGDFINLQDEGNTLLANTTRGLYYSTNGGRSWVRR